MSDKRGPLDSLAGMAEHQTKFTIKLERAENWNRLEGGDLSYNEIRQVESSPFLQEFQQRLRRKRYIDNARGKYDVRAVLRSLRCCRPPDFRCSKHFSSTVSLPSLDSDFDGVIPLPMETDVSELDQVTESELSHYYCLLLSQQLARKINYEEYKEHHAYALLLEFLAVRSEDVKCVLSVNGLSRHHGYLLTFDSNRQLPFHLLIEPVGSDIKSYTPRSDFRVSIRDFPHLVLGVSSQPTSSDETRMLLQAACFSRIGNWLRDPIRCEPVVIMAICIDKNFNAHQHILYQPDVKSIKVVFNWF